MSRFANDTWRCFECGAENSLHVDPCSRCGKSHLPSQPEAHQDPAPAPAGLLPRNEALRALAEDLLRSVFNIAESTEPKWYKSSDEKIDAIRRIKDRWDIEAARIIKSCPMTPVIQAPAASETTEK